MEANKLKIINERIEKESKFGDKAEACRIAGITPTTMNRGLSRTSYDELTADEHKGIVAFLDILEKRKEADAKIEALC